MLNNDSVDSWGNKRGIINDRDRARQIKSYENIRYGKITPTDIDGCIEYHNKAYIIIEGKYGDTELRGGQKLALERLTDDLEKTNKKILLIFFNHHVKNCNEDIKVAEQQVTLYRRNGRWNNPNQITVKELCDSFISEVDKI